MKKLETQYSIDAYDCADKINQLVDLVNSQQEAIEKLEKRLSFFEVYGNPSSPPPEPADDKPEIKLDPLPDSIGEAFDDTHRTVTLRIPKGMRIGDAFNLAYLFSDSSWEEFITRSDTDLQKALDEVEHE